MRRSKDIRLLWYKEKELIYLRKGSIKTSQRGAWVAQLLVKLLTLDFSSGHNLRIVRLALCWAWRLLKILSLSVPPSSFSPKQTKPASQKVYILLQTDIFCEQECGGLEMERRKRTKFSKQRELCIHSIKSSEGGTLTSICCVTKSNSPDYPVLVYLSIKWQERLLVFQR